MQDINDDNTILVSTNINFRKPSGGCPPAAVGEMFLKLFSSSSELRVISHLLDTEIVAVTKIPYGKRSKYFVRKGSAYWDTMLVSYALPFFENNTSRSCIHRGTDGRLIYAIPVLVDNKCMACILLGPFYLREEKNPLEDTSVVSPKMLQTASQEICVIVGKLLPLCYRYVKQDEPPTAYDANMLFNYGSFYDYNLFSDTFMLSKTTAEIFGWDCKKTFKYADFVDAVVESDRHRVVLFMRDKIVLGDADYSFDTTILRKTDKRLISIEVSGTLIKDSKGVNVRTLGSITDITELKQTQEELEAEISSKNRLIRIIGHDLKNPFNGLIGFSELLNINLQNGNYSEAQEFADIIKQSATEGYDLLVNLLDYSNSQSNNLKMECCEFNLFNTVDSIFKLSQAQALRKGITLHNSVPMDTVIYSDEYKINTVLRNLISNAIKFCYKDGVVIVEAVYENEGILRVSVSDTGEIIPDHKLDKINRCRDVESTYGTAQEKGTSIGLRLCHSFLKVLESKLIANCYDGITTFYFDIRTNA